eukprot:TRINITY_DN5255_c0_g1_i2.p1 TRINITY_DN5255_c0_g1~~TRINITY_DN5255_c0_g1_i2.p1  ORF type:complete len:234 (+),score=53.59 TRINITY_DN5255_c0_g1_i2:51-704(+)
MDREKRKEYLSLLEQQWFDASCNPAILNNEENVMAYFGQPDSNPFYDRECNNERVKQSNYGRIDVQRLAQMEGQEYVYVPQPNPQTHLHVIQKQQRTKTSVRLLSCYYMAKGNTFQAPDLSTLIGARLRTAMHHLKEGFELAQAQADPQGVTGHPWRFLEEAQAGSKATAAKYRPDPMLVARAADTMEHSLAKAGENALEQLDQTVHRAKRAKKEEV